MSWNYRIIRGNDDKIRLASCYYDDAGRIWGFSDDASVYAEDTAEELREQLELMIQAFERPALLEEEIPEYGAEIPSSIRASLMGI